MKGKEIISAVLGSTFFAVPYLGLSIALGPSLVIGCAAYGASQLVLSGLNNKEILKEVNVSLYNKINKAKKQNKEIYNLIAKVEKIDTKDNLKEINSTVSKILEVAENNPEKGKKLDNFFEYYLPVLIKIVNRYDEIENRKMTDEESKKFMKKADTMIAETKDAFNTILTTLYKKDLVDADAEMKVYDLMLKADGIVKDKLIMRGDDVNEK